MMENNITLNNLNHDYNINQNNSYIKVLNWNVCTLSRKKSELYTFLGKRDIDIACISETRLKPNQNFSLPNYKIYRKDRLHSPGGGVALILKSRLKHRDLPDLKLKFIEAKAIEISTSLGPIRIVSIYVRHNCETPEDISNFEGDLLKLTSMGGKFLIIGDLNAKHTEWHNPYNNKNGNILREFKENGYFDIIIPNGPTRYTRNGNPSIIDLILTNIPEIFLYSKTSKKLSSSDHYPTISKISLDKSFHAPQTRFDYNRANWPLFRTVFNNRLDPELPLETERNIDDALTHLTWSIKEAQSQSVPLRRGADDRNLYLDNVTKRLISVKNAKRRQFNETRDPLLRTEINKLRKLIDKRLKDKNNLQFQNKIQAMPDRSKPFWTITKLIRTKPKPIPSFTDNSDNILLTDLEKSEALSDHFLKSHQINLASVSPMDQKADLNFKSIQMCPTYVPSDNEIRMDEITHIIRFFKKFKAPGEDTIMSIVLKYLPTEGLEFLRKILNKCLHLCYFPSYWKQAKVIPILKAGKDSTKASSYRPISLLSCISKIFEKLLLNRLEDHIFDNNIYMDEQFGFRSGHSTTQQLQRVVNHIRTSRDNRQTTVMALLDIEKAFDSVWHQGLILKLSNFRFPIYLIKILMAYLSNRSYKVHISGSSSNSKTIPAGVPQGSVLGPVLYNLYTSDFPTAPPGCHKALYADDTALFATGVGTIGQIRSLQKFIDTCTEYYDIWKIKPNSTKTEVIRFNGSQHRFSDSKYQKIIVNGTPIGWSNEVKYLGLVIDKKLTFTTHWQETHSKAKKALGMLFPLLNRNSKLSRTNKLAIYLQVIRPIMTYAAPIWRDISLYKMKALQVVQNKALKMAYKLHHWTRTPLVHQLTKVPMVNEYFSKLQENFRAKNISSNYEIIRNLAINE